MELQSTPNKLSRRSWLRDAAITATGAVVLPSVLTGCSDHPDIGKGGLGSAQSSAPLTNFELYSAAQNLLNMNAWVEDVYLYTGNYEQYVLALLKSGEKPSDWKDFIINVLTQIATGMVEAAAVALEAELPFVAPAFAIAGEFIRQWAFGDRPGNLEAEFAEFKLGHLQMQKAISDTLLKLADETDNYRNLREGWTGEIDFNGKKYTLRDLANAKFPTVNKGTAYVALRTAAYDRFRKYVWNVMILKAGSIIYSSYWNINLGKLPTQYGRDTHYKDDRYKSTYLRGWLDENFPTYYFRYWYLSFDGRELSPDAAKELFKDDTPGNIINPAGLFNRDYVFKQFHREKPDFFGYHELRRDIESPYENLTNAVHFDPAADDFVFTGGDFPQLIKK